jgi:hypothetical protein
MPLNTSSESHLRFFSSNTEQWRNWINNEGGLWGMIQKEFWGIRRFLKKPLKVNSKLF